jgi:hypothetical protein
MENINEALDTLKTKIKEEIIKNLPKHFSSYDFHNKFRKEFEKDYSLLLHKQSNKSDESIFKAVHSSIGRHLKKNFEYYKIRKMDKKEGKVIPDVNRKNIFGDHISNAHIWERI